MAKRPDLTPPSKTATAEQSSVVQVTEQSSASVPSIQIVDICTLQPIVGAEYKTTLSAACDIPVSAPHTLIPGETFMFSTGLRLLVKDWIDAPGTVTFGDMRLRSSMRKMGLSGLGEAVIDLDYEGEIKILVHNHSKKAQHIAAGTRVAQLIFITATRPNGIPIATTTRGEDGFGSTGK
jgi:dUTP pyrophosphatase